MRIVNCKATTLPVLMEKIRAEYGDEAVLMSVRRVKSPENGQVVIEGTVSYSPQENAPVQQNESLLESRNSEIAKAYSLPQLDPNEEQEVDREFEKERVEKTFVQPSLKTLTAPVQLNECSKSSANVFVLLGPVGSGKTTTAAKIAGKVLKQHGKAVGLISTDTERPGGTGLLFGYANELSLQATSAKSASDLRDRLARWNCRGPLVIDTRGCAPRDSWAVSRLGSLLDSLNVTMEKYLVLSATEHPAVARECIESFGSIGLSGAILTRIDQAAGMGHCLEEVMKRQLKIAYIGTGDRVPGDLLEPTPDHFRALKTSPRAMVHQTA